jgi:hypothetical protein
VRKRQALAWLAAIAAVALMVAGCGTVASGTADSCGHGCDDLGGPQAAINTAANASVLLCKEAPAAESARIMHLGGEIVPGYPMAPVPGAKTPPGVHSIPNEPVPWVTVTQATARWLARAVCALPVVAFGARTCPIMIRDAYKLLFTVRGRQLGPVTVQTTDCRQVTGVGSVRSAQQDKALLQKLAALTAGIDNGGPMHSLNPGGAMQDLSSGG